MSGTFPGKTHNNLNNCVRKMRAPDVCFADAVVEVRYAHQEVPRDLGNLGSFLRNTRCSASMSIVLRAQHQAAIFMIGIFTQSSRRKPDKLLYSQELLAKLLIFR
jgi:hypothetical protein